MWTCIILCINLFKRLLSYFCTPHEIYIENPNAKQTRLFNDENIVIVCLMFSCKMLTINCVSFVLGLKVFGGYFDVTYSIRVTDTEVITAIRIYVRCLIDLWGDVLVLFTTS